MSPQSVFGLQFLTSLLMLSLLAKWALTPWLASQSRREALFWLTLPHAFRCFSMAFIGHAVVTNNLPNGLATAATYGGLLTGMLALLALLLLRFKWKGAVAVVWVFNVVGTIDLLNMVRHVEANFGPAWFIPTILVPLYLVTHFMIFDRLPTPETIPENSTLK